MEEMNSDQLVKQVYEGEVTGRRPRGRSRKQWSENFKYSNYYNAIDIDCRTLVF